jgi:predicted transcriptional regulator
MPLDRMRKVVDELISFGLVGRRIDDPGIYTVTARGMEFLDAFKKLAAFLE